MSLIEIQDSKEIDFIEAENKYKNSNYLMINIEYRDGTVYGVVCTISTSPDTLDKLVRLEDELQAKGIKTLIGGEYTNDVRVINIDKIIGENK